MKHLMNDGGFTICERDVCIFCECKDAELTTDCCGYSLIADLGLRQGIADKLCDYVGGQWVHILHKESMT